VPGQLEARIEAFAAHYNHLRYHESIDNLTPANVYFALGQTILLERERIKRKTMQHRRLLHKTHAALKSNRMRCQRAAESPQFWACNFPHFGGVGDQPFE
jgi:hypothetical protein